MEEKENKKTAALNALQKIRERVKPGRESAAADQLKEEYSEEKYKGVRIVDDPDRGLVQMFFPDVPAEKVRRYLNKRGFAWEAGERCWQSKRVEGAGYHARKAVDRGEL